MKKRISIGILAFMAISQNSFGFIKVEAQAHYDSPMGSIGGTNFKSSGFGPNFSLHLDPIPLVPISAGVRYASSSLDVTDSYLKAISATSSELALEAKAWLPLLIINIYGKASYIMSGALDVKSPSNVASYNGKLSGFRLALGLEKSFLPFLSSVFEVGYGAIAVDNTSYKKDNLTSLRFSAGINIGI